MKFTKTIIDGIAIIEQEIHGDNRGYFIESFRADKLQKFIGHKIDFVQDNESRSSYGVLRGLHYQLPPFAQTKLIRVIQGKVLDVAVDIRKGSPTFGKHISIELSGENKIQLLIPRGFAHGFVVLEENTIFAYKVDNYYSPEHDRGIAFYDKTLNINWKIDTNNLILSKKDKKQPLLSDAKDLFKYGIDYYDL